MIKITTFLCICISLFCSAVTYSQNPLQDELYSPAEKLNNTVLSDRMYNSEGVIPLYDSIAIYHKDELQQDWGLHVMHKNFIYNEKSLNIYHETWYFDGPSSLKEKNIKSYNDQDQLTRNIRMNLSGQNDTVWDEIREYDQNGNFILNIIRVKSLRSLEIWHREIRTFDANGNMLTYTKERQDASGILRFTTKEVNTYDANNLMESQTFFWENNEWNNSGKAVYTQNSNGLPSEILYYVWSTTTGAWKESQKHFYTYDSLLNITERLVLRMQNGQYINGSRITKTYTGNACLTYTYELWTNNAWVMNYKVNNEYDENLNRLRHRCYDLVGTEFSMDEDIRQTFDKDNIVTSYVLYDYNNYSFPPTFNTGDSTAYFFKKALGKQDDISSTITVYPNPTYGPLSITANSPIIRTELYNSAGALVRTSTNESSLVDLSSQPTGIYLLKVVTSREVIIKKIIKR